MIPALVSVAIFLAVVMVGLFLVNIFTRQPALQEFERKNDRVHGTNMQPWDNHFNH